MTGKAAFEMGVIDVDLQGHFGLIKFRKFELIRMITCQGTKPRGRGRFHRVDFIRGILN